MIHPLFHLIATRPQLLAEHAQAYAELLAAEITQASAAWKRRAILLAAALCCLGVAAVLAGVALMLWAVVAEGDIRSPWALIVTPLLPLAAALICLITARAQDEREALASLRLQVSADMAMLREVSA
jgi:cytochrome bd-type quinol oxidase subunit 2